MCCIRPTHSKEIILVPLHPKKRDNSCDTLLIQSLALCAILLVAGALLIYLGPRAAPPGVNSLVFNVPGAFLAGLAPILFLCINGCTQKTEIRSGKPVLQEIKKEQIADIETLFWNQIHNDKGLETQFYLIFAGDETPFEDKIQIFLATYELSIDQTLSQGDRNKLAGIIRTQAQNAISSELKLKIPNATNVIKLACEESEKQKVLITLATQNDGSCGPHALLGDNKEGTYVCHAVSIRTNFVEWIRRQEELPERIKNVLDDYFIHWDNAPSALKASFSNRSLRFWLSSLFCISLSERLKDSIRKEFRKKILEDYLANLAKPGTYMLQDELITLATFANKTLILCQPGWGEKNRGKVVYHVVHQSSSPDEEPIAIWFNGINHYERAILVDENYETLSWQNVLTKKE